MNSNILIISLFIISGCTNKVDDCLKNQFYSTSLGIKKDQGDNFYKYLIESDLRETFQDLSDLKIEDFNSISYYSLNGEKKEWQNLYKIYRINDFIDDIDKQILLNQLSQSYSSSLDSCERKVFEIEEKYLQCYLQKDNLSIERAINEFHYYANLLPQSSRITFLWAKINLQKSSKEKGLTLFNSLLEQGYYQKPILKTLINYYLLHQSIDSVRYYTNMLSKKFPNECNIGNVYLGLHNASNYKSVESDCKRCFSGYSSKDSIRTQVFVAQFKMQHKMYDSVKLMFQEYLKNNSSYSPDSVKTWERGEYYDLMLRVFFLEKKYDDFVSFLIKDVGLNNKIVINDEHDLLKLVVQYYREYINKNAELGEIKGFYDENFKKLKTAELFM